MDGQTILLMYSTGAKTGERRRSILTYSKDGDGLVVAGHGQRLAKVTRPGSRTSSKNPSVELEVDTEVYPATATVHRDGPERDRLWNQHVQQLPWFGDYPSQVGEAHHPGGPTLAAPPDQAGRRVLGGAATLAAAPDPTGPNTGTREYSWVTDSGPSGPQGVACSNDAESQHAPSSPRWPSPSW